MIPQASTDELRRKRFTRSEIDRLLETDFFAGQRCELIDGDLLDKMGQSPAHACALQRLSARLWKFFGVKLVRSQFPMHAGGSDFDFSVPEPDIAVTLEDSPAYGKRHPRGDEMRLVIEVSDTTAAFDLSRKMRLYARAGVPEYWVLDLNRRILVVHRENDGSLYRKIELHSEDDAVSPEGRPESIKVREILPEA